MLSEYFWFQYTFQYILSAIFLPVNSCKRCWWQILSIFFNSFTCILVIWFSQSSLWRGLAQCFDFSNLVFLWTKTSSADLPSRHLLQEFHEVPRCFSVCVKHSQHVSNQWGDEKFLEHTSQSFGHKTGLISLIWNGFYTWSQWKISLLSPLIGSKLTFFGILSLTNRAFSSLSVRALLVPQTKI